MKWIKKKQPENRVPRGAVLIYALDGFLTAGGAPRLAAQALSTGHGEVVYEFDIDELYDYRARRPFMTFSNDHYHDYDEPTLQVVLEHDAVGTPYFLLAGPEPDFRWELFTAELADVVRELDISLTLGLGAVPMGVPHTRPLMITAHGNRPELVDRANLWSSEIRIPSSAQSLVEYRFGEDGLDAAGYVVHVPHYLAQIDYPPAAIALLDAVIVRTGLQLYLDDLRAATGDALHEIEEQIADQDGEGLLAGLEEQYDAFTRGAAQSLLAEEEAIPTGDELADQFERFLARQRKHDDN